MDIYWHSLRERSSSWFQRFSGCSVEHESKTWLLFLGPEPFTFTDWVKDAPIFDSATFGLLSALEYGLILLTRYIANDLQTSFATSRNTPLLTPFLIILELCLTLTVTLLIFSVICLNFLRISLSIIVFCLVAPFAVPFIVAYHAYQYMRFNQMAGKLKLLIVGTPQNHTEDNNTDQYTITKPPTISLNELFDKEITDTLIDTDTHWFGDTIPPYLSIEFRINERHNTTIYRMPIYTPQALHDTSFLVWMDFANLSNHLAFERAHRKAFFPSNIIPNISFITHNNNASINEDWSKQTLQYGKESMSFILLLSSRQGQHIPSQLTRVLFSYLIASDFPILLKYCAYPCVTKNAHVFFARTAVSIYCQRRANKETNRVDEGQFLIDTGLNQVKNTQISL